jgi:N-formylglutamate amidohydrolase
MERTSIIEGSAPIIIVAPHGGDNENVAFAAETLAKDFGAFAVINRGWKTSFNVDPILDLANCNNLRHLHEDVVREEFLNPIMRSVARIKRRHEGRVLMIVMKSCRDEVRTEAGDEILDMIVGYGSGNPPYHSCRVKTKNKFVRCLKNEGFEVFEGAAGGRHAGKSKNNLNQLFVRWYPDENVESLQLEIVRELVLDQDMAMMTVDGLLCAMESFMDSDGSSEEQVMETKKI